MSTKTNVLVLVPASANAGVNPAYAASTAAEQGKAWAREGIAVEYVEHLVEHFHDKLMAGVDPARARRLMLVEVEDAKRETLYDGHAARLMEKFKLDAETAHGLVAAASRHFHPNSRPTFEQVIAPVFARVQSEARIAFIRRAHKRSPMAQALVKSGHVQTS
jgi:hypothetical protein